MRIVVLGGGAQGRVIAADLAASLGSAQSDGLRSLIDTLPGVYDMAESGRLIEEIRAKCVVDHPRDLVAFVVPARWKDGHSSEVTMVDRADATTGRTAMSRTTALTTSACAQLVATGGVKNKTGVLPLERVSDDEAAYEFVIDRLSNHGIRLRSGDSAVAAS